MTHKNNSCAITGHRPHKLPWGQDEETPSCKDFKIVLKIRAGLTILKGFDTFYTGMSWGVDLIFGEIIAELKNDFPNIKLIAVIPFEQQHIKWHISYQERYFNLLAECDDIIMLSSKYNKDCYKQRNEYLVKHAKQLIAVYDDKNISSGTNQTINIAEKLKRDIIFINPVTLKSTTAKGMLNLRLL